MLSFCRTDLFELRLLVVDEEPLLPQVPRQVQEVRAHRGRVGVGAVVAPRAPAVPPGRHDVLSVGRSVTRRNTPTKRNRSLFAKATNTEQEELADAAGGVDTVDQAPKDFLDPDLARDINIM